MSAPFLTPAIIEQDSKVTFLEAYDTEYASNPAYSDFKKLVFYADDNGEDDEDFLYPSPMGGMKEWINERPYSQLEWDTFSVSVRKFADTIACDVDEMKSAKKRKLFETAVSEMGAATVLWEPSLFLEALTAGLTKIWKPDGQKIFDVHNFNPRDASIGTARNYYSKTAQGGSAAKALTYANLLAYAQQGYSYKLPNGKTYAVRHSTLAVGPGLYPTALALTKPDMIVVGGVLQPNEIKNYITDVVLIEGMGTYEWMLYDASTPRKKPIGMKIRQAPTWQQLGKGSGGPGGLPDEDEGEIPQVTFEENRIKYGVKARGDAFFRNWWGFIFLDGTP